MASATSTAEERRSPLKACARRPDLADELLELICVALADDYCIGVTHWLACRLQEDANVTFTSLHASLVVRTVQHRLYSTKKPA